MHVLGTLYRYDIAILLDESADRSFNAFREVAKEATIEYRLPIRVYNENDLPDLDADHLFFIAKAFCGDISEKVKRIIERFRSSQPNGMAICITLESQSKEAYTKELLSAFDKVIFADAEEDLFMPIELIYAEQGGIGTDLADRLTILTLSNVFHIVAAHDVNYIGVCEQIVGKITSIDVPNFNLSLVVQMALDSSHDCMEKIAESTIDVLHGVDYMHFLERWPCDSCWHIKALVGEPS